MPVEPGNTVRFPKDTSSNGRSVSIHPDEALLGPQGQDNRPGRVIGTVLFGTLHVPRAERRRRRVQPQLAARPARKARGALTGLGALIGAPSPYYHGPFGIRFFLSERTAVHVTRQHSGGSGMKLRFPARA